MLIPIRPYGCDAGLHERTADASGVKPRHRTCDPELDDLNSLIRFLLSVRISVWKA